MMYEDNSLVKHYCEDCKWAKWGWATKDYPRCTHYGYRQGNSYHRRESDWDRMPFCSHINREGLCTVFDVRESRMKRFLKWIDDTVRRNT